ncbi:Basic leucine zipper protein [Neofusicoccum parvum]|uniref:Basic leucine zipper protein n=1 Tax=Neofusicoccum parvum TaxID=310453 RepID=A0ACB5S030_9PEZI|nr:Basic leucine zipper protein [Neofusicoccum parvum]
MAEQGGKNGTEDRQGWGHYLQYSLSIPVVNRAFAGRSARSFTDQSRFAAIEALLQPGDFVVVEFGHNDGGGALLGTANYTDNGRPACPGEGDETCASVLNGTAVTVHTYNWYLLRAARSFLAKGASVVVSSMTPTNPWETGAFVYDPPIFVGYAEDVAETLEAEEEESAFVNHGRYEADEFERLGKDVVDSFFLMDHTHTQPEGADVAAKAFVKGLACGGSSLSRYIVNATEDIPGVCL